MSALAGGNKQHLLWHFFEKSFQDTYSDLNTFEHFLKWPATTAFVRLCGKFQFSIAVYSMERNKGLNLYQKLI